MDDDSANPAKSKDEAANKFKDGYVQLAEKMEQVRNQMVKMERKYDELYRTVKEKQIERTGSVSSDQDESPRSRIDSYAEASNAEKSTAITSPNTPEKGNEESRPEKPKSEMDIEKMEDNPFL